MRVLPSSSVPPAAGLVFQYQPVLGRAPGDVLAFEALVRHHRPDGTIAGPMEILPVLTSPEKIAAFTRFTLHEAARLLEGDPGLAGISVNLSPQQVVLPDVPACLETLEHAIRLRLLVELTEEEKASPPPAALRDAIRAIRSLDVRVFLDDLTPDRLPSRESVLPAADGVKMDRAVVAALLDGRAEARSFLAGLLDLGVPIVAEGIEDAAALPRLRDLGLSHFQGFGLGVPWPSPRIALRPVASPLEVHAEAV